MTFVSGNKDAIIPNVGSIAWVMFMFFFLRSFVKSSHNVSFQLCIPNVVKIVGMELTRERRNGSLLSFCLLL